ncbi:MAG: DUF429 domain-containing protein [Nitratireductor sp.]
MIRSGVALAGVDGCKAGWIAAIVLPGATIETKVFSSFAEILGSVPADAIIAVDMPIGLPETSKAGGRGPERAVRSLLGPRQSSVFAIPSRRAVRAGDYREACAIALETSDPPRKVSKQAFNLFPKIREIDDLVTPQLCSRLHEVHPEVAFWRLNGERPMSLPKKVKGRVNKAGMVERMQLLEVHGIPASVTGAKPPRGAAQDDLLDACACLAIAERLARGVAMPFPDPAGRTAEGITVAIWA